MAARLWCYEMASLEVGETGAGNSEGAFNCAGPIKRTPCARLTAVMIYTAPKMGHQRWPAFYARAFFSGLPGVASACSVFGIAAGSPPSLYDGDLLRPHRSPYCLRA